MGSNEVGLARLFIYLANIKSFPTPLRAASCVSGMDEDEIKNFINNCPSNFTVKDDNKIYLKEMRKVG